MGQIAGLDPAGHRVDPSGNVAFATVCTSYWL
jgi:hypothetical protein